MPGVKVIVVMKSTNTGQLQVLFADGWAPTLKLAYKGLLRTNTLAYFPPLSAMKMSNLITLTPGS
jgi:hypothetical protein